MKPILAAVALCAFFVAPLAGCSTLHPSVRTAGVDVGPLVEEHDSWVLQDERMQPAGRDYALAQSAALVHLLGSAPYVQRSAFKAAVEPVVDRYDAYLVSGWGTTALFARRYLSRTSDIVRELADLPLTDWPPFTD